MRHSSTATRDCSKLAVVEAGKARERTMHYALKEISRQLAGIGVAGSFATRSTLPADDLHLEVKGVGRVRLPVSATATRKLCAAARPARHGFKDQTRLDPNVRDTWEIPKNRISIDQRRWKKTLGPALERIRGKLGLAETSRLKAELHNLLVYAPGQFFATHQDSEKSDDMIGTLVVSLPSRFTGGSFVIEHHDDKLRVGGSDTKLTLVAFYADCRHEVRPIKQGHRSFLRDCRIIERPRNELERAFEPERAALVRFIEDQHREIGRTFDPKVPLVKRRKIMVKTGAFD
jgi:hypothetical protein